MLLIRAMIAAAHADGVLDRQERENILARFEAVGLSKEERSFLVQELLSPASMETIVSYVDSPELAREVFAASLLAMEVDCEVEKEYLANLAGALGLAAGEVQAIKTELGCNF